MAPKPTFVRAVDWGAIPGPPDPFETRFDPGPVWGFSEVVVEAGASGVFAVSGTEAAAFAREVWGLGKASWKVGCRLFPRN